jgi:hypothetical protein
MIANRVILEESAYLSREMFDEYIAPLLSTQNYPGAMAVQFYEPVNPRDLGIATQAMNEDEDRAHYLIHPSMAYPWPLHLLASQDPGPVDENVPDLVENHTTTDQLWASELRDYPDAATYNDPWLNRVPEESIGAYMTDSRRLYRDAWIRWGEDALARYQRIFQIKDSVWDCDGWGYKVRLEYRHFISLSIEANRISWNIQNYLAEWYLYSKAHKNFKKRLSQLNRQTCRLKNRNSTYLKVLK